MMEKYEKPEKAVSGHYLPEEFAYSVANELRGTDENEDFADGFLAGIVFASTPESDQMHGMNVKDYMRNCIKLSADYKLERAVNNAIMDALKGAGFDVRVGEIALGGDR